MKTVNAVGVNVDILHDIFVHMLLSMEVKFSVTNSDRSSVIADHLGLLVGQNRCRFLKMTEHN